MTKRPKSEQILELARKAGFLRPRELTKRRIPTVYLRRLYRRGLLAQAARGLYRLPERDVTANHSLAQTSKRIPHGVVCLLSALRFHGLTTQAPFEVWLAIDQKARSPKNGKPSLRLFRMSGEALHSGVEEHLVEGVTVRVFSPAKT